MINKTSIRSYSELQNLETFEERFDYLSIPGSVGEDTFGFDRYLNQQFYKSKEWSKIRDQVILRDGGCDLGIDGEDVNSRLMVHHMNPVDAEDVKNRSKHLMDPEYLICVSENTHNAIHFGNRNNLRKKEPVVRKRNDQCPWKKE